MANKHPWQNTETFVYLLGTPRGKNHVENVFMFNVQGPVEEADKTALANELVAYLNSPEIRAGVRDRLDRIHARGKYVEDESDE